VDEPTEEVVGADPDQREDDEQLRFHPVFTAVERAEDSRRPWIELPGPLTRREDHVFRYFLDGSLRTYRWGEKLEGNRSFPVIVTEIGCAVMKRGSDGTVGSEIFRRRICLLLPPSPPVSDDTATDLGEGLKDLGGHGGLALELEPLKKAEHKGDIRNALLGKARSVMHELEVDVATTLPRSDSSWLIIDGAIRKSIFLNLSHTIGVAKSFSKKPVFVVPPAQEKRDVVSVLNGLPLGARSLVFMSSAKDDEADEDTSLRIASWYLRLRTSMVAGDPLHGVIKVDYVLPGAWDKARDRPIVDRLSRALLAERSVCPYPEPRWAAHLYPIHCAEIYLKANLLNPVVMRGLMEA
jgi:hypothetical protein